MTSTPLVSTRSSSPPRTTTTTMMNPALVSSFSSFSSTSIGSSSALDSTKPPASNGPLPWMAQTAAATCGAVTTALIVQPFDVVKTRLQAPTLGVSTTTTATASSSFGGGTWEGFRSVAVRDGWRGLWKGLSPTLVLAVPSTGIYYSLYDHLKSSTMLTSYSGPAAPFVAGITSRTLAASLTSPLEMIRTYRQGTGQSSSFGIARSVISSHGLRGLWLGLSPTLLRDVPFSGLYWLGFERIKADLASGPGIIGPPAAFIAGMISGSIAGAVTIPVDVIKTKMQVDPLNGSRDSATDVVREIMRTEGWRGFTRGLAARVLKVAPACAVMISTYEVFKAMYAAEFPLDDDDDDESE